METNNIFETIINNKKNHFFAFDFNTITRIIIINWYWFLISLAICVGIALIYLRYTTPIYQANAKLLIERESRQDSRYKGALNIGIISQAGGLDNEMEILRSHTMATLVVKDLKLYTTYNYEGRVKTMQYYKDQPVNVDIDEQHLDKLNGAINLVIERTKKGYTVKGSYPKGKIDQTFEALPGTIKTRLGTLTISRNSGHAMKMGDEMEVQVLSPYNAAYKYRNGLKVMASPKGNSIIQLFYNHSDVRLAKDYLEQLAICYNRQANEDKNYIALRTEEFINDRIEKISSELSETEGELESYKKYNNLVEYNMNASNALSTVNRYDEELSNSYTQIALLNSINEYINQPENRFQSLPSGVGLQDAPTTSLITKYNDAVLHRNQLLLSASESSPSVQRLTEELTDLKNGIQRAIRQAKINMEIQHNATMQRYKKFFSETQLAPEHERNLTRIGRQQNLRSALYMMLLQKREENSISLAATADKGQLIDRPEGGGKISPNKDMILLYGLIAGLAIPIVILFLIQMLRYKIEGRNDVERLTSLPILADVAIANESAKSKAGIVVHENKNNQMEEVFRSMRTNLQFMLKNGQNVVMFTSTTSGEGKTFNVSNLAVSFALLDKKVVLVGLDIRKPRLSEQFELNNSTHGITNLLTHEEVDEKDLQEQILPSGINKNLDILLAGPIPPNPTELVARNSLDKIFDILRKKYDYVLIDTAPVGLVTDTLHIGRVSDATIYMCRADYTQKTSFRLINDLHEEKKLPNMAIVLNGIDMSKKKYGYYYGYGRYGRYGGGYGYGYGYGYGNYSNSAYSNKNDDSIKL